jgi:hypothetical protein
LKKAQLEQDAKRGFIFAITGDEPPEVNEAEIRNAEEFNAVEKAKLKGLKRDIENMQVKAVEIAKSNSKSESTFQSVMMREYSQQRFCLSRHDSGLGQLSTP